MAITLPLCKFLHITYEENIFCKNIDRTMFNTENRELLQCLDLNLK